MPNDYFNATGNPGTRSPGSSSVMRTQFSDIEAAFDKLPTLTANGNKAVVVNAGGTGLTVTAGTLSLTAALAVSAATTISAATSITAALSVPVAFTTAGTGPITLTGAGSTNVTLPTTGTLATLAGAETLTNKTISGSSNTLQNIANGSLVNAGITINGTGIALGQSATITAAASSIVIGTTAVTGGTNGRILYQVAGAIGQMTTSGSGTVVALATAPSFDGAVEFLGTVYCDANLELGSTLTYGSVTLSASVTGTGSMVLSASPTLTGTLAVVGTLGVGDTGNRLLISSTGSGAVINQNDNSNTIFQNQGTTRATLSPTGILTTMASTAIGAGANTQAWIKASSTANLGVYYGTGDPSFSAAKGSLYVKTDATTTTTRFWINTNGSTTWTNFTTAA